MKFTSFIIYRYGILLFFNVIYNSLYALRFFYMTSLGFRDPEIGRGVPNRARLSKNKQTNMALIFYISLVFCAK